ncbi:multidrug effflux MFS transporter [Cellulophaga baltica]|uniref:multidrug effflux MFS transporter n=1 Tax=Cellulophaga TaxID=104264 RepID=UPI001C06F565|nr:MULTISPECIES: multidrug effflux MFS transporter [Cellulophaga]MBU2996486.1 multidrug effflux MFS transporter [Cellulophaga baltica]MDO6767880.1 multidrug effflux MFS transporter [Cellulophaga sp. 1_MG-2023]
MQKQQAKPNFEFIALMASLMSIVALTIDALLPALSNIGLSIHSHDSTDNKLLVTMIFLGLGVGQLFFGPMSDSYGRKPIVYTGFAVFIVASIICVIAPSLEVMIFGRILQGVGLSASRTISISIIRDTFEGNYMAKIMSFVTAFFILVPVIAPAIGKVILDAFGWRAIFYWQVAFVIILFFWFWKRQPETLHPEYKVPFKSAVFISGFKELIKHKETLACTMVSGFVTGSFLVYLSSAQNIFEEQYGLKEEFPYLFAMLAISIGVSTFLNGTLVLRYGMRKLAFIALLNFTGVSLLYVFLFWGKENPSIEVLMLFLSLVFFSIGFIFGNMRSIAMEPIGHIAGIGAAMTGFISTIISIPIATFIGNYVVDSVLPLFFGLCVCGALGLTLFLIFRQPASEVVLD